MHTALVLSTGAAGTSGRQQPDWHVPRQPALTGRQQHRLSAPAAAAAAAGPAPRLQRGWVAVRAAAAADGVAAQAADEWVEVGRVGPPHGVRGEMKVQPLTDFPEDRLGEPGARWLQAPAPKIGRRQAAPPEEVELEWGRMMISKGNEVWLVKLVDVESPEEAALLRGHTLLIPASAREALQDEDEFYVQDLVGLQVFMQASGEEVGRVTDVFDGTGTHDVMRIQLAASQLERLAALAAAGSSSQEEEEEAEAQEQEEEEAAAGSSGKGARHVLMPFVKAMVPMVDVRGGRLEITPPEGLLELAAPSNLRRPRRENRGKRERRRTRPRGQSALDSGEGGGGGSGGGSSSLAASGEE